MAFRDPRRWLYGRDHPVRRSVMLLQALMLLALQTNVLEADTALAADVDETTPYEMFVAVDAETMAPVRANVAGGGAPSRPVARPTGAPPTARAPAGRRG